MSLAEASGETHQKTIRALKNNLGKIIKGKDSEVEFLVTALVAGESILIQDVPGVGKTTLARSLAASLDLEFHRIQCTPDLMPADVFGVSIFNPEDREFHFRKGPVFTNVLLVDEINRASPRTQSALLEAMAERQVTIEGKSHKLNSPFMVIATQNPSGSHGTFPLPSSQLDRFAIRMSMDYPDLESELEILYQQATSSGFESLEPVLSLEGVVDLQRQRDEVKFEKSLAEYLLAIVDQTRKHPEIELGCSPRGAVTWFKCSRALALVRGRDFVLPDDIQTLAPKILPHRLVVSSRLRNDSRQAELALVKELLESVDVPV